MRLDRTTKRRGVLGFAAAWLVVVGWVQLANIPPEEILTHSSPEVQERLHTECDGSFNDRYRCEEDIVLEVSRTTFANLSLRLAVTVAVPLICLGIATTVLRPPRKRRRFFAAAPTQSADHPAGEAEAVPEPPHDDMSWKTAAREHVIHAKRPEE